MPVAIIAAGVAAVGTVAAAGIGAAASSKAVNAQTAATNANNSLAREQFAVNQGNLNPAIERGNQAGGYIADLLGTGGDPAKAKAAFQNYQGSTGYQYQLQQGLGAVNSNAYARGMGDSGATLKALQSRGNALADQSFNSYVGNLQNISSQGSAAAGNLAGVSQNYVSQVSANNNGQATTVGNAALSNAANISGSVQNLINAGAYAYGSSYGAPKVPATGGANPLVDPRSTGGAYNPNFNYINPRFA